MRLEVVSQAGHKGTERLSVRTVLRLSPQGEARPLFFLSSSRALGLEVISRAGHKGTERLFVRPVLCLSPQAKPVRFSLDIQVFDVGGVFFDEVPARFYFVPHEDLERFVCLDGVLKADLEKRT